MSKRKKQFREGKINFAAIIAKFCKNPAFWEGDEAYIRATLATNFPELAQREYCPNCDASMVEYIFSFDILDALLLYAMAKEIKRRRNVQRSPEALDFTIANQVHVPSLPTTLAIQCRTTQCSKLGLVAKVKNANGRHARGIWCITERGWAALRGEEVPAQVRVFRGKIEERFEETITIGEAFRVHLQNVQEAIARNRNPKSDYRGEIQDYLPSDWVGFGGYHEGNLV